MERTIINGRWLFMAVIFLMLTVFGVVFLDPAEWWYGAIVAGIGGIAFLAHFLLAPHACRFDGQGLTLYYGFGLHARAEWKDVKFVSVRHDRVFPWRSEYRIGYFQAKLPFHEEGILPKTKRITQALQTYWNGEID